MHLASHRTLHTLTALLACAALLVGAPAVLAQTAGTKPAAAAKAAATAKPAAKTSGKRPRAAVEPPPPALTVEDISPAQLGVAGRVLTGNADCEFKQQVSVLPIDGMPGYFKVEYQRKQYRMLPRETATGAVRLEDPDAGIVWLQIPAKSMLMNARIGQRLIDNCQHAEQRAAVNAVADAATSLGIVAPVAASAAPAASAAAVAAVAAAVSAASAPAADAAPSAPPAAVAASAPPAASAASAPAAVAAAAAPAAASAAAAPASAASGQ